MTKAHILHWLGLFVLLLTLAVAAGCKEGGGKKDPNVDYYTCTMHPSVKSKDPGKCPICSMDLVPVMKSGAIAANGGMGERANGGERQHTHGGGSPIPPLTDSPTHDF